MGGHCCGLPFGIAAKDLRVISTIVTHPNWPRYKLASSHNSRLNGADTCVIVLPLLIAFPELLWICALNGGGEVWGENVPGTVGVGTDAQHRMGAIYCLSIQQQIELRALYVGENPNFQFTSRVQSLATLGDHQKTKGVGRTQAVAAVTDNFVWSFGKWRCLHPCNTACEKPIEISCHEHLQRYHSGAGAAAVPNPAVTAAAAAAAAAVAAVPAPAADHKAMNLQQQQQQHQQQSQQQQQQPQQQQQQPQQHQQQPLPTAHQHQLTAALRANSKISSGKRKPRAAPGKRHLCSS